MRRCKLLPKTNRYTDGSGRHLDGTTIPKDLYLQPLNSHESKYPVRPGPWQPVIAGQPSPYKGKLVVAGAGIVGCVAATMMALRGWHVTVIEPLPMDRVGDGRLIEMALVTKRAMDALHVAGVRKDVIAALGTRVTGVMDHAGNVSTWLTYGLRELQAFPVNMVAVDVAQLRRYLVGHVNTIPLDNAKIFDRHEVAAILAPQKMAVVRRLRDASSPESSRAPPPETAAKAVIIGGQHFEGDVEGVEYDVLLGCDGADSAVRRFLDLSNMEIDKDWDIQWASVVIDEPSAPAGSESENGSATKGGFVVNAEDRTSRRTRWWEPLQPDCIHRWATRVPGLLNRVATVLLFPRGSPGAFSAMIFAPRAMFDDIAGTNESRRAKAMSQFPHFLNPKETAEVNTSMATAAAMLVAMAPCLSRIGTYRVTQSTTPKAYPLVYAPHLCNHTDVYPNVMLLGDAAHATHPFLMQGLSVALEDVTNAVNNIDSRGTSLGECVRQYSRQRGPAGDAVRRITERSMFFHHRKHKNPFLRFRNTYSHAMHYLVPRYWNEYVEGSPNYLYPRSVETMLNGRGYCPYEEIDWHQHRSSRWWCMSRLYT